MRRTWTKQEVDFLRENIDKMTYEQMADILDRSKNSVIGKCYREEITKDKYKYVRNGKRLVAKKWETWEDNFILKNQDKMTDAEMGKHLNRTKASVKGRKRLLRAKQYNKSISCPKCHSKRFIGRLDTYHYFCRNCLVEFNSYGKILQPIK